MIKRGETPDSIFIFATYGGLGAFNLALLSRNGNVSVGTHSQNTRGGHTLYISIEGA